MRGLFEKDIRIIKNQKKMMLIFAGMGVLLLLSGVEISFILPYMASVMTSVAISTISYDSMDNGNSFLFTLPVRRKDYATEKYFFVCGFGAVSALIVAIACGILLLVRKSEMTAGVLGVETMICLLIVLLLAATGSSGTAARSARRESPPAISARSRPCARVQSRLQGRNRVKEQRNDAVQKGNICRY